MTWVASSPMKRFPWESNATPPGPPSGALVAGPPLPANPPDGKPFVPLPATFVTVWATLIEAARHNTNDNIIALMRVPLSDGVRWGLVGRIWGAMLVDPERVSIAFVSLFVGPRNIRWVHPFCPLAQKILSPTKSPAPAIRRTERFSGVSNRRRRFGTSDAASYLPGRSPRYYECCQRISEVVS